MIVGILSMQKVDNLGSLLQAYGLKKVLESLGSETEFMDKLMKIITFQKSMPKTFPVNWRQRDLQAYIRN